MLTAHLVAKPAEYERAKGTHQKAGGKDGQRTQQRGCFISLGKELRRDSFSQHSENVEIVPFDHRAHRRSTDHSGERSPRSMSFGHVWKLANKSAAPNL